MLFRYHCFLQTFRQFYPENQNSQGQVTMRGSLQEANPLPVIETAVTNALATVSANYRSCMGHNIPGETTYFEFAYLLLLPDLFEGEGDANLWKFSMTVNDDLLEDFVIFGIPPEGTFADCFSRHVATVLRNENAN
jgi:hypothetical protein